MTKNGSAELQLRDCWHQEAYLPRALVHWQFSRMAVDSEVGIAVVGIKCSYIKNKRLMLCISLFYKSAGGENRTRMVLLPLDFESSASTYFTTPAL